MIRAAVPTPQANRTSLPGILGHFQEIRRAFRDPGLYPDIFHGTKRRLSLFQRLSGGFSNMLSALVDSVRWCFTMRKELFPRETKVIDKLAFGFFGLLMLPCIVPLATAYGLFDGFRNGKR